MQLERGDAEAALQALRAAAGRGPDRAGITAALDRTDRLPRTAPPRALTGHTGDVKAVALSQDGRTGVSASSDGTIRVWDLAAGTSREVTRRGAPAGILAVSADGRHALFARFHTVELRETATGRCLQTWKDQGDPVSPAFGDDGRTVLTGDRNGTVTVREWTGAGPAAAWSYPRPRPVTHRLQEGGVVRDALERTATLIAEGRIDAAAQEIRRARAIPGYERHRPLLDRWHEVARAGQLSGDDRIAVSTGNLDGTARVWDVERGRCLHVLRSDAERFPEGRPAGSHRRAVSP